MVTPPKKTLFKNKQKTSNKMEKKLIVYLPSFSTESVLEQVNSQLLF